MSRVPSQADENGEGSDRQPLSDEDIERTCQLAFEAIDPRDLRRDWSAMVTLRWRLDKIFEARGTLTRETAVLLLRAISQSIKPATKVSGGLGGATNHPAIDLLDKFNDVLADLGRGKPSLLLKPARVQARRSLSLKQLREDEALLKLVQRTKDSGGLTTKEAEQRVAHKVKRAPNARERKIDQKKLASLRRHKKAKKSVAQLEFELFHRAEYEIFYKSL